MPTSRIIELLQNFQIIWRNGAGSLGQSLLILRQHDVTISRTSRSNLVKSFSTVFDNLTKILFYYEIINFTPPYPFSVRIS